MTRIDGDRPKQAIKRIFISYAKEDIAIAEKVDAFLSGKGFNVFRDRRDIDPGEEIWLEINRALSEADALVLLASPATMPYHRESYREWLPFDLGGTDWRPLRGGSWTTFKTSLAPSTVATSVRVSRSSFVGLRLVSVVRPPS